MKRQFAMKMKSPSLGEERNGWEMSVRIEKETDSIFSYRVWEGLKKKEQLLLEVAAEEAVSL